MLAQKGAIASSSSGLPQGTVFLSHMESLPATDEINGKNFVVNAGSPSITTFKFGNAIRLQSFQQIAVQSPVILQSTLTSDWTVEFWAKLITAFMNDGAPQFIRVSTSDGRYAGVGLIRDISNNRYNIVAYLPGIGSVYPSPYPYMHQGESKFFRLYKKGSEHGLIIDSTKYILSGTPTYDNPLGSHTTQSVYSGNNTGDFAIDEVLFCKDFGNDSTVVPTAQY